MDEGIIIGRNIIKNALSLGFDDMKCTEIDCIAFNINLDYVLKLFSKYPNLNLVRLFGNTEQFTFSRDNKKSIISLVEDGKIEFFHLSSNKITVHAKIYIFRKENDIQFGLIGSSNFSSHSNSNLECGAYVYDINLLNSLWDDINN